MADCVCLPKCPFFLDKMSNMPAMADIYKENYCQGDNSECARYTVFRHMGASAVPAGMFPNESVKAAALLKENGY